MNIVPSAWYEMMRPDYVIRGESVVTSLCRKDTTLVTGSEEGNIKLYDTEIMRPTATWKAHKSRYCLQFWYSSHKMIELISFNK